MRAPVGEGRERLLDSLFDEFGDSGPEANLSMRQIADRIGVHHTLMAYHFGSRTALLRAVLTEARRRDNAAIAEVGQDLNFSALSHAIWDFYSDPAHTDRVRAFFHLIGMTIYDLEIFQDAVADVDGLSRILKAAAQRDGDPPEKARQRSLIATSCLRGLLLQKLLTPEADLDAAACRLIDSWA